MVSLAILFSLALKLFILMDPIGNIPLFITFLKELSPARQRVVIVRELLIALAILILFNLIGGPFLKFLEISSPTLKIAGGIILFIISIRMIFPSEQGEMRVKGKGEPFIVPLAIPLIAGPAVLAAIMIFSEQVENIYLMLFSILIAWSITLIILLFSPNLGKLLKERGIIALEKLMGLILTLLAVEMFLEGLPGVYS